MKTVIINAEDDFSLGQFPRLSRLLISKIREAIPGMIVRVNKTTSYGKGISTHTCGYWGGPEVEAQELADLTKAHDIAEAVWKSGEWKKESSELSSTSSLLPVDT